MFFTSTFSGYAPKEKIIIDCKHTEKVETGILPMIQQINKGIKSTDRSLFYVFLNSALTSMSYRNWKSLGLLAASFTAWASSMEPRPPCAQWWHGTASEAPHSLAISHTRSISAWVSVLKDHQGKRCQGWLLAMVTNYLSRDNMTLTIKLLSYCDVWTIKLLLLSPLIDCILHEVDDSSEPSIARLHLHTQRWSSTFIWQIMDHILEQEILFALFPQTWQ